MFGLRNFGLRQCDLEMFGLRNFGFRIDGIEKFGRREIEKDFESEFLPLRPENLSWEDFVV